MEEDVCGAPVALVVEDLVVEDLAVEDLAVEALVAEGGHEDGEDLVAEGGGGGDLEVEGCAWCLILHHKLIRLHL